MKPELSIFSFITYIPSPLLTTIAHKKSDIKALEHKRMDLPSRIGQPLSVFFLGSVPDDMVMMIVSLMLSLLQPANLESPSPMS